MKALTKETSSAEVRLLQSLKKELVIWGRGGAGRKKIHLGCQACYSGNRTFITQAWLGPRGMGRQLWGQVSSGSRIWGLGSGSRGCGLPSCFCTHTIPRHKGREDLEGGVGLGHLSSQHPARESPLSLLPSRTSYKFVGPSAK